MTPINDSIEIDAPATLVWDVLTKPEWTEKYMFGCRTVSDWTPGSALGWAAGGTTYVTGFVVRCEPPNLLEYTMVDATRPYASDRKNHLHNTYSLEGKRLTITTKGFDTVAEGAERYQEMVKGGGWKSMLEKIKALAEGAS
jgi:uncharacterized protein YndB with AHSA1/START domain